VQQLAHQDDSEILGHDAGKKEEGGGGLDLKNEKRA
jgi:hypothetical protein